MSPNKTKTYVVKTWPGEGTGDKIYQDNYNRLWINRPIGYISDGTGDRSAKLMDDNEIKERP